MVAAFAAKASTNVPALLTGSISSHMITGA
jgi:hypothetical protein